MQDAPHIRVRNAEAPSNFPLRETLRIQYLHLMNLVFVQPCSIVLLSLLRVMMQRITKGLPTLLDHVLHVVFVRAQEQVIWIDAESNVTSVEHQKSFRNRPVGEKVSKPVRSDLSLFYGVPDGPVA